MSAFDPKRSLDLMAMYKRVLGVRLLMPVVCFLLGCSRGAIRLRRTSRHERRNVIAPYVLHWA